MHRSLFFFLKEWQPPFCVNVDEFRFTPRIQHIHELEAGARAKMKFYERLAKLFESQGMKFKIPTVERESLDLAKLHKVCFFAIFFVFKSTIYLRFSIRLDRQRTRRFRCLYFTKSLGTCCTSNEFSRRSNGSSFETTL